MDDVIDDLYRLARRCRRAATAFEKDPIASQLKRLSAAADSLDAAASGGWLGYHACIYLEGFPPRGPHDYFDTEWGGESRMSNQTRGAWVQYDRKDVLQTIRELAQVENTEEIEASAAAIGAVVKDCRADLLPTLDALLASQQDSTILRVREAVAALQPGHSQTELLEALVAGKQFGTRDRRAISEGIQAPPHVEMALWVTSQRSYALAAVHLAEHAEYLAKYCEKARKMKGRTVAKINGKIFIGHGRSRVWKDLKDFLEDRLQLSWDEFNRDATAGLSTKERLESMLDEATFAFIVMTAEDEQADKTKHARANVIHEAGLFQGRLGFARAIVLLEEGCEEFSNISGLGQIRFPPGDIASKFEEIRRVLEREKLI